MDAWGVSNVCVRWPVLKSVMPLPVVLEEVYQQGWVHGIYQNQGIQIDIECEIEIEIATAGSNNRIFIILQK